MTAAALKPGPAPARPRRRRGVLRGRMTAAALKPSFPEYIHLPHSERSPRSDDRGCIEARQLRRVFRVPPQRSPRSDDRCCIEADITGKAVTQLTAAFSAVG